MNTAEYIGFVAAEGDLFATAAEHGSLDVEIEPCPGWTMRDMVRHLGMIHLWAAANVAFPDESGLDVDELPDLVKYWPDLAGPSGEYPADGDLIDWYRTTLANLLSVLSAAPADVAAFRLLATPAPLKMWARRQASEIAIHRFDAEQARGWTTKFDAPFASDMLDELLCGFAVRPTSRKLDVEGEAVIQVCAEDSGGDWSVAMSHDLTTVSRGRANADLTVSGAAADLYVLFWNRTPATRVSVSGDAALMDMWHNNFRIRWS